MKRLIAIAAAGGLLLVGAFALVSVTSTSNAAAETKTIADDDLGVLWESRLERFLDTLVEQGVLTEEQAEEFIAKAPQRRERLKEHLAELEERLDDAGFEGFRFSEDFDRDRLREQFEDFDFEGFRERLEGIDWEGLFEQFEDFDLDSFGLEGFELPEGFDPEELEQTLEEMMKRFEEFDIEGWRGPFGDRRHGFEFRGFGLLDDLTPEELREALENGTLDELIDLEELEAEMEERHQEMVDELLESGRITEDQLAEMEERFEQHLQELEEALENGEFPFGRGFRGHGGPGHGGWPFGGGGDTTGEDARLSA